MIDATDDALDVSQLFLRLQRLVLVDELAQVERLLELVRVWVDSLLLQLVNLLQTQLTILLPE